MEIIMHRYKEMDLEDSTVINGFPSTSLINSIVAGYLINVLNLDQICGLDSDEFPPVSMIYDSKPKFPARIYADEKAKIVVFLSEFTPYPPMARNVANTVLSFAEEAGCSRIISPETQILDEDGFKLFGIGSTDAARNTWNKFILSASPLVSLICGSWSAPTGITTGRGPPNS